MGHVQTTSECGLKYTVWHFAPTTSRTEMSYSHSQSVYSNLRHSNEGQLTAVKLEHPVTIITLLYRGFIFLPIEVTYFFKVFRWYFIWSRAQFCILAEPHSLENLYTSQKIWQSRDRIPTVRPSAPQSYQCLISHFLASLRACNLICAFTFWSMDSCQNSVSTEQYRLIVSEAKVWTYWVGVFFEVIRWQVTTFQMIVGSRSFCVNA